MPHPHRRRQMQAKASNDTSYHRPNNSSKNSTEHVQVAVSTGHDLQRHNEQNNSSKPYTALLDLNGNPNIHNDKTNGSSGEPSNHHSDVPWSTVVIDGSGEEGMQMQNEEPEPTCSEYAGPQQGQGYYDNEAILYCGAQFVGTPGRMATKDTEVLNVGT